MSAEAMMQNILGLMKAARCPLTETQELLLAGSLPVWVDKIRRDAREQAQEDMGERFGTIKTIKQ